MFAAVAACAMLLGACAAALSPGPATAQPAACERSCLEAILDGLLASIAAGDAGRLPLAPDHLATENLAPAAPSMMTPWREPAAGATLRTRVVDPVTQQVFFVATLVESGRPAWLYGRIGVRERRIAALELYVNRLRGRSGYMFDPAGVGFAPDAAAPAVRATRAALLAAGRSMFDPALAPPPAAPGCTVIETGMVAHLDRALQSAVTRDDRPAGERVPADPAAPRTTVPVGCDAPAHRPPDPAARFDIVDEEQGLVVGIAVVRGIVSPFLVDGPSRTSFLPDGYDARYKPLQDRQRAALPDGTPLPRASIASAAVSQIWQLRDGRIAGFRRFIQVQPPGATSPWAATAR